MECNLPGSSVHGISQARILGEVAIFLSRGSSWPRDQHWVSCIGRRVLYHWFTREARHSTKSWFHFLAIICEPAVQTPGVSIAPTLCYFTIGYFSHLWPWQPQFLVHALFEIKLNSSLTVDFIKIWGIFWKEEWKWFIVQIFSKKKIF